MKRPNFFYKILIIYILCFTTFNNCLAQTASTQGRDFWFAFMNNHDEDPTQTCLILSAERACQATVSNPNTGWSTTVSIPAGGRVDITVPLAQGYHSGTDGSIYNIGCHLTATDVISAYSMNYRHASFDGGHLLPTETLADNYMIETIPPGISGSTILIVGTENNTIVDITPTVATNNGWGANTQQSISLNAGQVFEFSTSSTTASFSGTTLQTRDCKRIAVFAGSKCAQAPAGCDYCDHVYEPMVPTIYWGNHFAVTTSLTRTKDVVRVTALNANTTVSKNGVVVTTLSAGATYDFELTSAEGSCYIATSGPSVCYLYLTGQGCGGGTGDPSMVYITPIEQNIKKIIFGTYQDASHTYNHYVNIVTPTVNVNSVTLDGTNISGQFTPLAGNANYSFARINISHASHTLQCDSGLVAHIYGLANVTSYAYNVGSSAIDLSSAMYINNVSTADIPDNCTYCANLNIHFEVDLNYGYENIGWDFGDGTSGSGNPIDHAYPMPGAYQVMAIVERNSTNNCFGTTTDTLHARVVIVPTDPIVQNIAICEGSSYNFYGQTLTEPGIYIDTVSTAGDCDSIVELHLSFVPAEPIPVFANFCPGESYDFNGQELTEPGTYLDTIATAGDCDSIVELHLAYAAVPTVNLGNDRVICGEEQLPINISAGTGNNMTYLWSNGATTPSISAAQPDTYAVTVTNQYGCTGSDEVEIRIQEQINVRIDMSGDLCEDGNATLSVITNAPNVTWSTGESATEIEVSHPGTFSVRAFDGPCEESTSIELPKCPFDLYFPNCITPTFDDGINDVFSLSNPESVSEFEIFIYDRWGTLVFHSTDPHFKWDGKHKGKIVTNNVFTWKAYASPRTEKKKREFNGSILVL